MGRLSVSEQNIFFIKYNDRMGIFYIVSTPIGNLEDISLRGVKTLLSVQYIACEDTRITGNLLELLRKRYGDIIHTGQKPILISYRDMNEQKVVPELIDVLEKDNDVALVSDAGTPLISDPGYRIVHELRKRSVPIVVVPGPSAFLAAITGSGLPVNIFTFLGYLPEKQSHRKALYAHIRESHEILPSTYVCYVAPHKLHQTVEDLERAYGEIQIHIARELTKVHEEFWRGTPKNAKEHFVHPKGEFVLSFSL